MLFLACAAGLIAVDGTLGLHTLHLVGVGVCAYFVCVYITDCWAGKAKPDMVDWINCGR